MLNNSDVDSSFSKEPCIFADNDVHLSYIIHFGRVHMDKKTHEYDDIIQLPHHQSATRPQMPLSKRAAQFAPFAALSGYEERIREVERLTEGRLALSDDEAQRLNERLLLLREKIADRPEVRVLYFVPDKYKEGGAYLQKSGSVRRLDEHRRVLVFTDGAEISIDDLHALDGAMFEEGEDGSDEP